MDNEILQKILEKLDTMDKRFDSLEQEVATIKADVSVLRGKHPLVKQVIFETQDIAGATQNGVQEPKKEKKGVQFYDEPISKSYEIPYGLDRRELLKELEKEKRYRRWSI